MPRGGRGSNRVGRGSSRRGTRERTARRGFGGGFFLPLSGDQPLHEAYCDPNRQESINNGTSNGTHATSSALHRSGPRHAASRPSTGSSQHLTARLTGDRGRLCIPIHIKRLLRLPRMRHLLLDCVEYHANHGLASLRVVAPEFDVDRMVRDMRLEMAMFSVADEDYFTNQMWRLDNVQACIAGARPTWATLGPLGSAVGIIHQYLLEVVDSLGLDGGTENSNAAPPGLHGPRRGRGSGRRQERSTVEDDDDDDPFLMDPWAAYGLAFLRGGTRIQRWP